MIRLAMLAAALQAFGASTPPTPGGHATLCLDTLGVNLGAVCSKFTASRIDVRPDICQCRATALQVRAPYCRLGEQPQAETAGYDRARYAAAQADGTLIGKSYKGRSFCVTAP